MTEQKKLIVLGALFAVMLAVGAFQFIPKKTAPLPPIESTAEESAGDSASGEEGADGELVDGESTGEEGGLDTGKLMVNAIGETVPALPARDPFMERGGMQVEPEAPVADPVQNTPEPPRPPRQSRNQPSGGGHGSQPFDPGSFGFPGGLPTAGNTEVVPTVEPEPHYLVKGVLVGNRPMAVFEDDKGNQRLVPLGGAVDGDTTVVGIERGKVTIKRRGKEKTLVIQEEARND